MAHLKLDYILQKFSRKYIYETPDEPGVGDKITIFRPGTQPETVQISALEWKQVDSYRSYGLDHGIKSFCYLSPDDPTQVSKIILDPEDEIDQHDLKWPDDIEPERVFLQRGKNPPPPPTDGMPHLLATFLLPNGLSLILV